MFLLNTEIEVNWLFPATTVTYLYSDFDVIVKKPDGSSSYTDAAILEADYIAPTIDTVGGITYRLTPDQKGVWVVILTLGAADDSELYNEYFLRISESDTHIYQQVNLG